MTFPAAEGKRPGMNAIGVVGLGLMGRACVARLRAAGMEVLGFDIDPGKALLAESEGATSAHSLADLGTRCRAIALTVFDTAQVETVIEGRDGLMQAFEGLDAAPVVLCLSTCDPDRLAALDHRCRERGLRLVEVPISGSSLQFARGEGVGLVGGNPEAIAAAGDVLDALCPRRHSLGPVGNGSRAKLAVNLILGLNRAALAEGLVFAERLGLGRGALLAVARQSAAYSQVMDVKGDLMAASVFDRPQSKVDQSLKDFRLMIEQAAQSGQRLPFAEVNARLLGECVARGEGALDNAIVVEAIARMRSD
jgi:putative dehydrogenase